jgi:hypothetical protein
MKPTPQQIRLLMAEWGKLGGRVVTAKKLAHLKRARQIRAEKRLKRAGQISAGT